MPNNMDNELQNIIDALINNKCVLILGPEICEFSPLSSKGKKPNDFDESIRLSYDYYINNKIVDDEEKQRVQVNPIKFDEYPFAKENFLNISNTNQKHLYNFMRWYFEQMVDWKIPFSQIAQIPFSLIISLLPDEQLEKTMSEINNESFVTSHYSHINKAVKKIDEVPTNTTVLYKLLGNLKTGDAIFTYKDWFDFIHKIFKGSPEVPNTIINRMDEAEMIVFLGVRVEKWYIQILVNLLFHLGKITDSHSKIAFVNVSDKEERKLANDRLKVSYQTNQKPITLLDDLYQACKNEDLLKASSIQTFEKIDATVFISYNHADLEIALRLKGDLEKKNKKVIIDGDNPTGFEIPTFINESISEANYTLQLISENFLSSAWVAQESMLAFSASKIAGKFVLPCEIDESLRDITLVDRILDKVENKILEIDEQIKIRRAKDRGINDLSPQLSRLLKLKHDLDTTIAEFRIKNRVDLRGNKYESGVVKIIADIQIYQSKIKR